MAPPSLADSTAGCGSARRTGAFGLGGGRRVLVHLVRQLRVGREKTLVDPHPVLVGHHHVRPARDQVPRVHRVRRPQPPTRRLSFCSAGPPVRASLAGDRPRGPTVRDCGRPRRAVCTTVVVVVFTGSGAEGGKKNKR